MKLKTIIAFLTLLLVCPMVWADDPSKPKEKPDDPPIVLDPFKPKPHTEDGDFYSGSEILAYVSADGTITLVFSEDMGMVKVELQEFSGTVVYSAVHPSAFPAVINVSPGSLPLLIEVTCSEGTVYGAILQ